MKLAKAKGGAQQIALSHSSGAPARDNSGRARCSYCCTSAVHVVGRVESCTSVLRTAGTCILVCSNRCQADRSSSIRRQAAARARLWQGVGLGTSVEGLGGGDRAAFPAGSRRARRVEMIDVEQRRFCVSDVALDAEEVKERNEGAARSPPSDVWWVLLSTCCGAGDHGGRLILALDSAARSGAMHT